MGRILQIRVSAYTYDENQVAAAWPALCGLAWDQGRVAGANYGVLELGRTLAEKKRLGLLSGEAVAALGDGPEHLDALISSLEAALGDWNPTHANQLSEELEEALGELEKSAKNM